MTTELKTVRDHPAALLETEAARFDGLIPNAGMGSSFREAAEYLRTYEAESNATLANLDNEALKAVTEAYVRVVNTNERVNPRHYRDAQKNLVSALGKLFGRE